VGVSAFPGSGVKEPLTSDVRKFDLGFITGLRIEVEFAGDLLAGDLLAGDLLAGDLEPGFPRLGFLSGVLNKSSSPK
jgi:hypothetical protein